METETQTDLQAIMDVLQQTYGDATQTELDWRAASAVLQALRQRGWMDLQTAAVLVASTPGRSITVDHRAAMSDWVLYREDTLGAPRFYARPRVSAGGGQ